MATKVCPSCGGEFVASIDECPDCEVALGPARDDAADDDALDDDDADDDALDDDRVDDDAELDSSAAATTDDGDGDGDDDDQDRDDEDGDTDPGRAGPGEKLEYALADWAGESRTMLAQLLRAEGVPHAWQAGNLIVPASFEVQVDGLVEQVEVATLPTLDPDAPKVAYDIDDWTDEQQTVLMERLESASLAYEFDLEGALVVEEKDEEAVEDILDAIEYPDALPADDGADEGDEDGDDGDDDLLDDVDAAAVLSDLFVAADRLKKKATDPDGVLTIVDVGAVVGRMRLPYGFDRDLWRRIVDQAVTLKETVEDNVSSDDEIEELAEALRATLRPVV